MKIYTGIGSRSTPDDILAFMRQMAKDLFYDGWTLRSGGADGADLAFETGAADAIEPVYDLILVEIYLPWASFNSDNRTWIQPRLEKPMPEAYEIAHKYHPNWHALSWGGKSLHARNVHQVLGADLKDPTSVIICWTENGEKKGGTAQALRIADDYHIPILNLGAITTDECKSWFDTLV